MALFPAYSEDSNKELTATGSESRELDSSYAWLREFDICVEEDEQQELETCQRDGSEAVQSSQATIPAGEFQAQMHCQPSLQSSQRKKMKKGKKKKKKKKKTEAKQRESGKRHAASSGSSSDGKGDNHASSDEESTSGLATLAAGSIISGKTKEASQSRNRKNRSTSKKGSRSGIASISSSPGKSVICRSRSRPRKGSSYAKSKSEKRRTRSESRSKSRSTDSSLGSSKYRYKNNGRNGSGSPLSSKSKSGKKHEGSRSRSGKRQIRSRSSSRKRFIRSRSRSGRRHAKSRSRSRKRHKRSRSRSRKRYTRSRSRSRKRLPGSRSRSRERYRRSSNKLRKKHTKSRSSSRNSLERCSRSRSSGTLTGIQSPTLHRGRIDEFVSKSKTVFLEGLQGLVKPEQAFFVSTDGDTNNNAFTATHYSQLASYKVSVKGQLGNENPILASTRKKRVRYFKKPALKLLYSDAVKIRTLPKNISEPDDEHNQTEYIPLTMTYAEEAKVREVLQPTNINPLGMYDISTLLYLQGLGDTEQEEVTQSSHDIELEYWQRKSREYNERLGKEPTNVSLWLEFVRFQDDAYYILFQDSDSDNSGTNKKSRKNLKALAERKISILDTAIKKNIRSLKLNFERLEIGQDIWDDKKLRQEWDALIFNFPNSMSVWHHYLSFTQTHFTSFNLPDAVRTFSRCTERLLQMQSGVFLTHAPPAHLGHCLVDVAAQLARVWRQCGHMERAVALFQALVELSLFLPPHIKNSEMSLESQLALFEPFWDSRAPRFGEDKAVGWAQVMARKETVVFPEVILEGTHDEEDGLLDIGGPTSQLWLALETSRERRHWMPWEQDPEDCEDPERMVPLDDLSPHLFVLDSEEECFYLILNFLKFLQVPEVDKYILKDQSKTKVAKTGGGKDIFDPLVIETLFDASLFGNKLSFKGKEQRQEVLNFDSVGPCLRKPKCDDYCQFLCRVLYQAANAFSGQFKESLMVLYVKLLGAQYQAKMLETNNDKLTALKKEIKKQIKNVLKLEEFRTCLPVYEEYGKVEEAMGHLDDAANVYATALAVGTNSGNALDVSNKDLPAVLELFDSYVKLQIKCELETCNGEYIHHLLYSLCMLITSGKFVVSKGSPTSGGQLLKTKKKLVELLELHQGSLTLEFSTDNKCHKKMLAIKTVSFLALLQLFTVGFKPACLIYETTIEKVKASDMNPLPHKLEDITLPSENSTRKMEMLDRIHKCEKCERSSEVCKGHCGVLEELYEGYLWLVEIGRQMEHRVSDGCMSPLQYRSLLSAASSIAPFNNTFLLLTAQNQGWRNLVCVVDGAVEGKASITVLVSQLLPHLQRTVTLLTAKEEGSLSCGSRLESVLERAVSSNPGKHCPLLWRLYMALIAVTRPKALKDLAYRALAHCPAVKSVYLDCIRHVPGMLKEVVTLMTEKGMRVRLPLEELQVLTETELDFEEAEENQVGSDEEGAEDEEKETIKSNSLLDIPVPDYQN